VALLGHSREAPLGGRRDAAAAYALASARALADSPDDAQAQLATSVVVDGAMSGDGGG